MLEQQPRASSPNGSEKVISNIEMSNALQLNLALTAYKESHLEEAIDVEHPENNPRTIRNAALQEWTEGGSANSFREYIKTHVNDNFDLNNKETMHDLLKEIRNQTNHGSTFH